MSKLLSIQPNLQRIIAEIKDSDIKDRLYEMGIYPNQTISVVRKAPFGDPVIVKLKNQEIMLRLEEAELISVK